MSMDKWDEAAKKALADLNTNELGILVHGRSRDEISIILNAHADLRRTYGKLLNTTSLLQQMLNNKHFRKMFPESWGILVGAISDPDVIAAMKGEENG